METTTLKGLELSRLTRTLPTVPDGWTEAPFTHLVNSAKFGPGKTELEKMASRIKRKDQRDDFKRSMGRYTGDSPASTKGENFRHHYEYSPQLSFHEVCMIQESTCIQTDFSDLFSREEDEGDNFSSSRHGWDFNPDFKVFGRIRGSLWRWGMGSCYNTAATVFNEIRNFKLEHPTLQLEVRLDWATGNNQRGYTVYHRTTFMDGPLGFFIYHNGEHVLTASFAVTKGYVAICQIQGKKGFSKVFNGWDYKSAVIEAFHRTFTSTPILMVTGKSLSDLEKLMYQSEIDRALEKINDPNSHPDTVEYWTKALKHAEIGMDGVLRAEPRILKFYPTQPTERESFRIKLKANNLQFVQLHRP